MKVQVAFVHINSEKLMNKQYVLAKGEMPNAPSGSDAFFLEADLCVCMCVYMSAYATCTHTRS